MSLEFYAEQSPVTDPGRMAGLLAGLPTDIPALRRIARGLVVHYRVDDLSALGIPPDRVGEINTRYAEKMLECLFALDDRPLTEKRPPDKRLVGCCRDFTILFLMLLRNQHIPARARVGFASYFAPGWNVDHEVAEVWDATEERWRLIDAELDDEHVDQADGATLSALDVPRDRFLVAGEAWHACRAGDADPDRFLVDPNLDIAETRGWPQLRHNLIQDLANLNKQEPLLWDTWGLLDGGPSTANELMLLDRVAETTRPEDPVFATVQELYATEPGLRIPGLVTSIDPATQTQTEVMFAI